MSQFPLSIRHRSRTLQSFYTVVPFILNPPLIWTPVRVRPRWAGRQQGRSCTHETERIAEIKVVVVQCFPKNWLIPVFKTYFQFWLNIFVRNGSGWGGQIERHRSISFLFAFKPMICLHEQFGGNWVVTVLPKWLQKKAVFLFLRLPLFALGHTSHKVNLTLIL